MLLTITTTGKVTLLIVGGMFIAWAFLTAILIPRRNPDFPRNVASFITVTALLFAAQMGAVYWVTATQEVERKPPWRPERKDHRSGRDRTVRVDPDGHHFGCAGWRCDCRQGSLHVRRLHRLSHACRCGFERQCWSQSRSSEAVIGSRRDAGHQRQEPDAVVQGSAQREADRGRRRVRVVGRRQVARGVRPLDSPVP